MTVEVTPTSRPTAVAVYCASSLGKHDAYRKAAASVGTALAARKRTLVYGGGSAGMMGVVAQAALEGGGQVVGVVPAAMAAAGGEGGSPTCGLNDGGVKAANGQRSAVETIVVNTTHERKAEMAKRVGGFVALPGGLGTLDELVEMTTWTQIGIHNKPIVLLNVRSYFEPVRLFITGAVQEGFLHERDVRLVVFVDGPESAEQATFDWGEAALQAADKWHHEPESKLYDWSKKAEHVQAL